MSKVRRDASVRQVGVSLQTLIEFGSQKSDQQILQSAMFLHKELRIRKLVYFTIIFITSVKQKLYQDFCMLMYMIASLCIYPPPQALPIESMI